MTIRAAGCYSERGIVTTAQTIRSFMDGKGISYAAAAGQVMCLRDEVWSGEEFSAIADAFDLMYTSINSNNEFSPERLIDIKHYQSQAKLSARDAREELFELLQAKSDGYISGTWITQKARFATKMQAEAAEDFRSVCFMRGLVL